MHGSRLKECRREIVRLSGIPSTERNKKPVLKILKERPTQPSQIFYQKYIRKNVHPATDKARIKLE